jgi:hypothetical protein
LALNATNPEVKEAFELLIRGGTPDRANFGYPIPKYNTELEVLYRLALRNEFRQDDTLALAIAMSNGLWVTIGTDDVKKAVFEDCDKLLDFLRETDEMQSELGLFQLEGYPLEAKVALAWTGGMNMHWQGLSTQPKIPMRVVYYQDKNAPLVVYEKSTVSVDTLRSMREIAQKKGWWRQDVDRSVANVEEFFYFSGYKRNWDFAISPEPILDEGGLDAWLDVDWQFRRYQDGLKPRGDCGTETVFLDAWAKAMGISTVQHWFYKLGEPFESQSWWSHSYCIHYNPVKKVWLPYKKQITEMVPRSSDYKSYPIRYFIFRPPVNQIDYLEYRISWNSTITDYHYSRLAYSIEEIPFGQTQEMMLRGIPEYQMKEWLLYD